VPHGLDKDYIRYVIQVLVSNHGSLHQNPKVFNNHVFLNQWWKGLFEFNIELARTFTIRILFTQKCLFLLRGRRIRLSLLISNGFSTLFRCFTKAPFTLLFAIFSPFVYIFEISILHYFVPLLRLDVLESDRNKLNFSLLIFIVLLDCIFKHFYNCQNEIACVRFSALEDSNPFELINWMIDLEVNHQLFKCLDLLIMLGNLLFLLFF
jgi:hypothetical protein